MDIKLYLDDWFINIGLVGFIRILEHVDKIDEIVIQDNYIELDVELLEEFHRYYFDYFLHRYNICKRESQKVDKYLLIANKEEKFKDAVKWIRQVVDNNRKKLKGKLDNKQYEEDLNSVYKELGKIKKFNQLEEVQELVKKFKDVMNITEVNNKLTINFVRSMLYSQYFGQASFLQLNCARKTVEEQSEIVFQDYIKPIIEDVQFDNALDKASSAKELKEFVDKNIEEGNLSKTYNKFLKDITKLIKKKFTLNDIKNYIDKEILHCSIWEQYRAYYDFTEGIFVPLAVSNSNSKNFMWDMNTSYPISNLVKFILLCSPAGAVDMDGGYFAFLNLAADIDDIYAQNENFRLNKDKENPYEDAIYDIVDETKQKSKWTLENILFVEFNANYDAKSCKLNYFSIPKNIAKYFKEYAQKDLKDIKDVKFRKNLISLILDSKAIKNVVYKKGSNDKDIVVVNNINQLIDVKLRNGIERKINFAYDALAATISKYRFDKVKKGCDHVDSKKIWVIFKKGQEMNTHFNKKESGNKIQGIAYRLLNASKAGNKKQFMDSLLRIYMAAQKEVPSIFLNILHEEDIDFQTVAHAFVSGLISSEKENKGVEEEK